MTTKGCYIMRDQVRNLVPTLMKKDISGKPPLSEKWLYGLSVCTVTAVYLLAMTLSAT